MPLHKKPELKLAWVSIDAARHACLNWHYSRKLPSGKLAKIGVWEDGKFIGVVIFGRGANNHIATPYELKQTQVCELVRVAMRSHITTVSRILSISIKFLKKQMPGMRLLLSYADPEQGHHGGIYQAGNWIYAGKSQAQRELLINGVEVHKRSANAKYGTASPEKISKMTGKKVEYGPLLWKHTYLMPLDKETRCKILKKAQPFPSRSKQAAAPTRGAAAGQHRPERSKNEEAKA